MSYRAVFFDAGETLLSPHPSFHELFAGALAEQGRPVTPAQVKKTFESLAPTFAEVVDRMAISPWSTSKQASLEFWGRLYATALADLGIPDPQGLLAGALYSKFTRYESYRLFDDSVPTLSAIRKAGLVVGLISNFEDWLEGMLIEMEVAHLFDLMVISGKEGVEKPDPAIFNLALGRAGVSAEHALYVGDHPRIDVEGARAVGMGAVLIDRRNHHQGFEGNRIATLDGLLELLDLAY